MGLMTIPLQYLVPMQNLQLRAQPLDYQMLKSWKWHYHYIIQCLFQFLWLAPSGSQISIFYKWLVSWKQNCNFCKELPCDWHLIQSEKYFCVRLGLRTFFSAWIQSNHWLNTFFVQICSYVDLKAFVCWETIDSLCRQKASPAILCLKIWCPPTSKTRKANLKVGLWGQVSFQGGNWPGEV